MNKKPFILLCEDKPEWIEKFLKDHSEEYHIEILNDAQDFTKKLQELKEQKRIPDIILIDLFHPKHADEELQKNLADKANAEIERLENEIERIRETIYAAWEPYGLDMLKQVRDLELFHDTPIAIYTQRGLSIVGAKELETVSKAGGEWLLKGRSKEYESDRLNRMLKNMNDNSD